MCLWWRCRSPQGERGLKSEPVEIRFLWDESLSARRAWIEISPHGNWIRCPASLSARRAWIEIGARYAGLIILTMSLSARRAWIEIPAPPDSCQPEGESLSARRAWIEIPACPPVQLPSMSLSARRAWIEMQNPLTFSPNGDSRSPQGERGLKCYEPRRHAYDICVALRKESVD